MSWCGLCCTVDTVDTALATAVNAQLRAAGAEVAARAHVTACLLAVVEPRGDVVALQHTDGAAGLLGGASVSATAALCTVPALKRAVAQTCEWWRRKPHVVAPQRACTLPRCRRLHTAAPSSLAHCRAVVACTPPRCNRLAITRCCVRSLAREAIDCFKCVRPRLTSQAASAPAFAAPF
jgi:hypothetical protein